MTGQDKTEIQELTAKYACAMDEQNRERWLSTWAPNGSWEGGIGTYEGDDRLLQLWSDLSERIKGKRHIMTNSIIEGTGNQATQTCYMLIVSVVGELRVVGLASYQDSLQKIDGKWCFSHRRLSLTQAN